MEVKEDIIYKATDPSIHELIPFVIKYAKYHDSDPYLIASIFNYEVTHHPKLLWVNNPGNIRTEESDFNNSVPFESMSVGVERFCRLIHKIIDQNDIATVNDLKKIIRPLEPQWGDDVSNLYKKMIDMYRGKDVSL